jgi:4-diphosphocytidyl-2-C-methyl-D-erythritol kinase
MKVKAYAKINLSLDVLDKRKDNFHNINSVMQQIELYDELSFEKSPDVIVQSQFKDDIILRTIMKLKELKSIKEGVTVSVKKNIPVGGGFGGGSADCAATLNALDELWGLNLGIVELIKIGSDLGADVPFCIMGGSCFVSGKGESFEKMDIPAMDILIINPGYGISTKDAYMELDEKQYERKSSSLKLKNLDNVKKIAENLHNDFINIQKDDVKKIIDDVKANGALGASITGKGPSVFGIFENEEMAKKAYENLEDKYKFVWMGKTIE